MNIIEKTYKWASKLSKRKSTKRIILHHAEAVKCTADDIHKWHLNNGWAGIGYHFFVRKDGSIYCGRPEDTLGSHAKGANSDSIGICAEGSYMSETMPEAQKQAIKELVAHLKSKYGITKIQRHKDVTSTDCPGTNFPFNEIVNGGPAPAPTPQPTPAPKPTDDWVRRLQEELNAQFGAGLVVDGLRGPKTLNACPQVKKGAKGNVTRLIQERLNSVGFNLTTDGIFGENTKNAVKVFQKNRGLVQDGIVGPNTWDYLLSGVKY